MFCDQSAPDAAFLWPRSGCAALDRALQVVMGSDDGELAAVALQCLLEGGGEATGFEIPTRAAAIRLNGDETQQILSVGLELKDPQRRPRHGQTEHALANEQACGDSSGAGRIGYAQERYSARDVLMPRTAPACTSNKVQAVQ
jgi:hypothetical protein